MTTKQEADRQGEEELDRILSNIFSNLEVSEAGLLFTEDEHYTALKAAITVYAKRRDKRLEVRARLEELKHVEYRKPSVTNTYIDRRIATLEAELRSLKENNVKESIMSDKQVEERIIEYNGIYLTVLWSLAKDEPVSVGWMRSLVEVAE